MLKKTYSISELAVQLQLPRTTINDWLKSFAPYLEFEMRGKRKDRRQHHTVQRTGGKWKGNCRKHRIIQLRQHTAALDEPFKECTEQKQYA